MTEQNPTSSSAATNGAEDELRQLLGKPPLLRGEDADAYETLRARVRSSVKPKDIIEEIWVQDIVDLTWEILRLRRQKAQLYESSADRGLYEVLKPIYDISELRNFVTELACGNREAQKELQRILNEVGLDAESIAAQTLAVRLEVFDKLDRMIALAEARRNTALKEIERHRDILARRLLQIAQRIEEGEFTIVNDTPGAMSADR
jgi:hypothetical protein